MRFNEHEIEVARDLIYDRRQFAGNADAPVRMDGASSSITYNSLIVSVQI